MKEPSIEQWLASKNPADIEMAKQTLESMGPEAAITFLLEVLKDEERKQQKRDRAFGFLGHVLTWAALPLILFYSLGKFSVIALFVIMVTLISLSGCLNAAGKHIYPRHRNVVAMLAEYDDVRIIGPMADALFFPGTSLRKSVVDALIHLLPHLRPSDGLLLNPHQRKNLYYALNWKPPYEVAALKVAILTALEQIGDKSALRHVEKLANRNVTNENQQRVQEAAQNCLSILRQRLSGVGAHG